MRKSLFIILIFFLSVSGCEMLKEKLQIQKPTVKFISAKPHSFTFTSMKVDIKLAVTNPNPIALKLDKLDLLLYINDKKTTTVMFTNIDLPAKGTAPLNTTVKVPYKEVGTAIVSIVRSKGKAHYKLDGIIYIKTPVGMLDFPVTVYEKK